MRRLIHFVLILLVLGALGWTLWRGAALLRARAGDAPAGEAKADDEKPEDFVVKVEKEKWQALGVEKAEPEKTEIRPQRMAFGRVLDPYTAHPARWRPRGRRGGARRVQR